MRALCAKDGHFQLLHSSHTGSTTSIQVPSPTYIHELRQRQSFPIAALKPGWTYNLDSISTTSEKPRAIDTVMAQSLSKIIITPPLNQSPLGLKANMEAPCSATTSPCVPHQRQGRSFSVAAPKPNYFQGLLWSSTTFGKPNGNV